MNRQPISAKPGSKININGIDIDDVVGAAVDLSQGKRKHDQPADDKHFIAVAVSRLLDKMRSKGYTKEQIKQAVWSKAMELAQGVKVERRDEKGAGAESGGRNNDQPAHQGG